MILYRAFTVHIWYWKQQHHQAKCCYSMLFPGRSSHQRFLLSLQLLHTVDHQAITNLHYLEGLQLAHPISSAEQFTVTLLIGADQYWNIVEDHIIRGNGLTAVRSKLCYLLLGPLETTEDGHQHITCCSPTDP